MMYFYFDNSCLNLLVFNSSLKFAHFCFWVWYQCQFHPLIYLCLWYDC